VQVVWTREDDIQGGFYRPMFHHKLKGALAPDGAPTAWHHRVAGQSIAQGTPFAAMMVKDGVDSLSVEGARGMPYAVPNRRIEAHTAQSPVPVLWWRSVGHSHTGFVVESFIDEMAHAAGKDPLEYRLGLLDAHPKLAEVLKVAADKAGWTTPLPKGRGRGIAVVESFGSAVAEVAEVTVKEDGAIKVDRVVCVVECGIAVNPDVVKAQMEGGIGYGLGAMLRDAITFTDGHVDQTNFDAYRPLRLSDMPTIEVHILPSNAHPTGVGEPGVPPIAAAVANAVFAASGRRIRSLPLESA
jgi:isoquinoline 1-oxidoreductase beta subunit